MRFSAGLVRGTKRTEAVSVGLHWFISTKADRRGTSRKGQHLEQTAGWFKAFRYLCV